jgi:predicted RNA-binding protein (virulence factor B family)
MVYIGRTARLQIIREFDFGLFLHGGDLGDILLPRRYVPARYNIDDWLDVFIYLDSDDNLIATTQKPYAQVGECAYLEVVDTNSVGAFLDWGLQKDLLVPFKEQRVPMERGKSYVVYVFEDNSGRICGSSKLDSFLNEQNEDKFENNQEVDLLIASRSPMGYKAVINGSHLGLLHNSELLTTVKTGQKMKGYIRQIRPDDAIDLTLQKQGTEMKDELSEKILADLKKSGGVSNVTDRSPPEEIFARYQVSKGNYKKVLGQLYKDKKIILTKDKITLVE